MKKLLITTSFIMMVALIVVSPAFAWNGGLNVTRDCVGVTVSANPENPYWEDHSGPSQIKWLVSNVDGTGSFSWGGNTTLSGDVVVTWVKHISNTFGITWTNTGVTHSESYHWSKTKQNGCFVPVTLCHATGSASNPFETITVDNQGALNGHSNHGGDIIPAPAEGCPGPVLGCTDPEANNYNPAAGVDDGSCTYTVYGCTDPTASNYDPLANTNDGSCTYPVPGCTDPTASNYDPLATVNDGSCTYPVPGCTNPEASNYNPDATVDDGSCAFPVPGCTDSNASNYNPLATVDDGSCTYPVPGCTDPTASNYDPLATVNDGSCTYPPEPVPGCTDSNASNYNPLATVDDGSCTYPPVECPTGQHPEGEACVVDPSYCNPETGEIESVVGPLPPNALPVDDPACNPEDPPGWHNKGWCDRVLIWKRACIEAAGSDNVELKRLASRDLAMRQLWDIAGRFIGLPFGRR